jgi:hypothetical protein
MTGGQKGSCLFLNWRLCLQTSGIYRFPAIPGCCRVTGGAEQYPPLSGLAPESALRVHPCRALPSAPASTSIEEKLAMEKLVVVVDREK